MRIEADVMENRRNHERFGADMIFWMKIPGKDDEFHPFRIENISVGGILIDTEVTCAENAEVQLEFELPQHTDLIHARGKIRHIHNDDGGGYKVGLQFTEVEGLSNDQLLAYLEAIYK